MQPHCLYDDEYLETRILTATAPQLHLIVVDSALRFARLAGLSLEDQNFEQLEANLSRSRQFVSELIAGLNPEHNRELTDSLTQLFAFVFRNLALADAERSRKRIDDAIRILELHRATWLELLDLLPAEAATETESAVSGQLFLEG